MEEHMTKNKGPSITMEGYLISGMCFKRNVSSYNLNQQDICYGLWLKPSFLFAKYLHKVFLPTGA